MLDSRRELIKVIGKEVALKRINKFLYLKVITKRHDSKANLTNKINEVDEATVNGLLIKKILEYRQVRNYNREEENSLKANVELINKNVTDFRKRAYNMMNNIIKKQDKLIQFYENIEYDSQASDIMKMKQVIREYSRLIARFCFIVDEKHKRSIKLFLRSENKREWADYGNAYSSYITFDNLQQQNKLLRNKLTDRKENIQHEKDKLDEIILVLENINKDRKEKDAHITNITIPLREQNKEKCLKACSDIITVVRMRRKLSTEKALLLKNVGTLKYKNLTVITSKILSTDFIKRENENW